MSLSTPQAVTIDTVATDLNRISDDKFASVYKSADGNTTLTVSHQESKNRFRRMVRLDRRIIAADPLTALNAYQTVSVYMVIDEPVTGFTDAAIEGYVGVLKTWLTSANILAVLASRH
jgi:hypothetical protein